MEDGSFNKKISTEILRKMVLIIVDLVGIAYSSKVDIQDTIISEEELEKITYEYIHNLLVDKKYKDFLSDFSLFYNSKFSFCLELKRINKILMTMNQNQISKIYKIIKLVTLSSRDDNNGNNNNIEDFFEMGLNSGKINKNDTKDYNAIPDCEQIKLITINNDLRRDYIDRDKIIARPDTRTLSQNHSDLQFLKMKKHSEMRLEDTIINKLDNSSPSSIFNNLEINFNQNMNQEIKNLGDNIAASLDSFKDEIKSTGTRSTKNKTYSSVNSINVSYKKINIIQGEDPPLHREDNNNNKIKFKDKLKSSAKLFDLS